MFFLLQRPSALILVFALAIYTVLGLAGIQNMGIVGEVAWTWMDGRAQTHHQPHLESNQWGPFLASSTRPMEQLVIGDFSLPLLVNSYTGGLADWPARILAAMGASYESTMLFHFGLGGFFIFLLHRFVRIHGSGISASAAAILLACDWLFIFLRRSLGGTEILLHASVLLCLWALWSRRWAGGRHGLAAFALGVGLGLAAKLTFVFSLVPLMLTATILRWDKPRLQPPLPNRWLPVTLCFLLPLLPSIMGWLHHGFANLQELPTHDHLSFQLERVWDTVTGNNRSPRESSAALVAWLGNPMAFLHTAWGADAPNAFSGMRMLGFILVGGGTILAWRNPDKTPRIALARFCSLFLVLQVATIWLLARDVHHLAIASPTMAIVAGLGLEMLASEFTPKRSIKRGAWVLLGCLPWVTLGSTAVMSTDTSLSSINRPTVSRDGQQALVEMLRANKVQRLVTLDYESAGSLDILAPHIEYIHGWTRVTQNHSTALSAMLQLAKDAHVLVIPNAAAWRYNLRPQASDLGSAAAQADVDWEEVDRLPDDAAVLYAVGSQTGLP